MRPLRAEVTVSRPCSMVKMKMLRPDLLSGVSLSRKKTRAAAGRLLELAGRHARGRRAAVALLQLLGLLVRPGPDDQRQQRDHQQHRPAKRNSGRTKRRQAAAAANQITISLSPVHARQRADDGDEQRQRQHGRQVAQRGVAHHHQHVLRGSTLPRLARLRVRISVIVITMVTSTDQRRAETAGQLLAHGRME